MDHIANRLLHDIDTAEPRLRSISDHDASQPLQEGHWSRKEIIGHLIDSATNNHQRFVRLPIGDAAPPTEYLQEQWVAAQRYNTAPWTTLIDLWTSYNRHLAHVIRHVDPATLSDPYLKHVIEDYPRHLEHHLAQLQLAS